MPLADQLRELQDARDAGLLQADEFDAQRTALLASAVSQPAVVHQRARAGRRRRRTARRGDDDDMEEDIDEQERSEAALVDAMTGDGVDKHAERELMPISSIGFGADNDGREFLPCARRVCPWTERADLARNVWPLGVEAANKWLRDDYVQEKFASVANAPIENEMELRPLDDDKGAVFLRINYTSRLLHAVLSLNRQTLIEIPRSPLYSDVILPQHQSCVRADFALDGGPNGGLAGCAECVLWKMTLSDDLLSCDHSILELAALLGECTKICGDVQKMYCAMATPFTQPMMLHSQSKRIQDTVRYGMADEEIQQFHIVDEVDSEMLNRVVAYRRMKGTIEDDSSDIVPEERIPFPRGDGHYAKSAVLQGLFDVFIFKDIVQGRDAGNEPASFKIDMIRIKAKVPGVEPLLVLEQVCAQNATAYHIVQRLLRHMADTLQMDCLLASNNSCAFGTSDALAARLCCEAALPLAVFKFAASQNITDVHFGGLRVDVKNRDEAAAWNEYIGVVQAVRVAHFRKVQARVSRDLQPHGIRHANKPEPLGLDFFSGLNYRSVDQELVDKRAEELFQTNQRRGSALGHWAHNHAKHDGRLLICDGRPWARNTGVWLKLNLSAFEAFDKRRRVVELLQPHKVAPMVQMYLWNKCEPSDPLEIAWDTDFVPDIHYIEEQNNALPDALSSLRNEVIKLAVSNEINNLCPKAARWEDLYQLYGRTQHNMHSVLHNAELFVPLNLLMERRRSAIDTGIKHALMLMSMGELKHWKIAARTVKDLHAQSKRNAHLFADENSRYEITFSDVRENNNVILNEGNGLAVFSRFADLGLDLQVAWQNNQISDLTRLSQWANFAYQNKCWGMSLKVADGGSAFEVLVKQKMGQHFTRTRHNITTKKMGSGIDSTVEFVGSCNNAWGKLLVLDEEARKFYWSDEATDVRNARMSGIALATVRGCGLPRTADGQVNDDEALHKTQAGTVVYRTEHNKHQTESENSRNFMADLEVSLADSGAGGDGKNVVDEVWATTYMGKHRTYEKFLSAPILVIAGNRQDKKLPESTFGGGRMQAVISGTLDGNVGVVPKTIANTSNFMGFKDMVQNLDAVMDSEDRVPMKQVDMVLAQQHPRWFLLLHVMRKVCFLMRTLTVGPCYTDYEFKTSFVAMATNLRAIVKDSSKTMFRGKVEFDRNAGGPWWSVHTSGTHAMQLNEICLARAIRACPKQPDLYGAVFDSVAAMKYVPMLTTAKLSAAYLWLSSQILDPNQMILFSYVLHTMQFINRSCSIRILARAVRGLPLCAHDQVHYDRFCEWLVPLCTVPCDDNESSSSDIFSHDHASFATKGCVRMPLMETLKKWIYWESNPSSYTDYQDRHQGPNNQKSVYLMGRVFDTAASGRPRWLPEANAKPPPVQDEYIWNSPDRLLAQLFASSQSKEADDHRRSNTGRQQHCHVDETSLFWTAAHEGCRLPKMGKQRQDDNEIVYDSVHETGHWYVTTMQSVGSMSALTIDFLMMCGLGTNTNHEGLMTSLLAPYLQRKGLRRAVVSNSEWQQPVVSGNAFKWYAAPTCNSRRQSIGVSSTICIKLVTFVLVQSFFAHDWKTQAIVHTRNIGQWALDIMSLFLHNHVDLASIPSTCRSGILPLCHRTPFVKHQVADNDVLNACASLWFEEELHIDTTETQLAANMLSTTDRFAKDLIVYTLKDSQRIMYYKRMKKSRKHGLPSSQHQLFPFPPESVAHMQTHYMIMNTVVQRFCKGEETDDQDADVGLTSPDLATDALEEDDASEMGTKRKTPADAAPLSPSKKARLSFQNDDDHDEMSDNDFEEDDCVDVNAFKPVPYCNKIAVAMLAYGQSVSTAAVRHIPVTLTHCFTKREIPCVTYREGYCFVLVNEPHSHSIVIRTTRPTHQDGSFSALPLRGVHRFEKHRIGDVMSFGLALLPKTSEEDMPLVELQTTFANKNTLPFYMHPAVHWPHLLAVCPSEMLVKGSVVPQCEATPCSGCQRCCTWSDDEYLWQYRLDDNDDMEILVPTSFDQDTSTFVPATDGVVDVMIEGVIVMTITLDMDSAHRAVCPASALDGHGAEVCIGILAPFDDDSYMQDGLHCVRWFESIDTEVKSWNFSMDFLSAGQCVVREGRPVYLKLHAVYQDLVGANLRVEDESLHWDLTSCDEEAYLEVFYVLGHDSNSVRVAAASDELSVLNIPLLVDYLEGTVVSISLAPPDSFLTNLKRTGPVVDSGVVNVLSSSALN